MHQRTNASMSFTGRAFSFRDALSREKRSDTVEGSKAESSKDGVFKSS